MNNAVIMAGGFGTRLRPLTMSIPKPMVPLANRPMMGHIVNLLKQHGITKMVSVLYFQPEEITSYFGDGSAHGVQMDYVTAEADYGTAGSVKNAQHKLGEPFIIISGDVLTDFDITAAIDFHRKKGAMATIVLTRVPQPLQYGIVMTTDDGRISRFLEKPSWGEVFSDTINTGIYILEPEVLDLIPEKTEFDFSQNLFPTMLEKGLPLYGYIADGYWCDVGNISEYVRATANALEGQVPGIDLGNYLGDGIWAGKDVEISPSAYLRGPIYLGNSVQIKSGVTIIGPTVIRDYTVIDNEAQIDRSILWRNCYIGERVQINGAVILRQCSLKALATVFESAVIGDGTIIGEGAVIHPSVKIWPGKEVEPVAP